MRGLRERTGERLRGLREGPARSPGPQGHPGAPEAPAQEGYGKPKADITPERLFQEAQNPGAAPLQVQTSSSSTTTIHGAQAQIRITDPAGTLEIVSQNGQRTMTATDPAGTVVFTGPVNTPEERAAVPEEWRKKLQSVRIKAGE